MLKTRKHKKEKTMGNYEVKGVSQATEIRKAYEEAVKANAPKYRAISKTNLIYGWDEKANKFIKAEIGQEWFDNPHYVAPIEETVEPIVEEMVEVANEMVEEVKAEEVEEPEEPEVDYKALYEEKCKELEKVKKGYEVLKNDLDNYKVKVCDFLDSLEELKKL
jgi:hypothetical protein